MNTTVVSWDDDGTKIGFNIRINTPDDPLWSAQVVAGHIAYQRNPIEVFYELSNRLKTSGIKCMPNPMEGHGKIALKPLMECLESVPNPQDPQVVRDFLQRLQAL